MFKFFCTTVKTQFNYRVIFMIISLHLISSTCASTLHEVEPLVREDSSISLKSKIMNHFSNPFKLSKPSSSSESYRLIPYSKLGVNYRETRPDIESLQDEYIVGPTIGDGNCFFHAVFTQKGYNIDQMDKFNEAIRSQLEEIVMSNDRYKLILKKELLLSRKARALELGGETEETLVVSSSQHDLLSLITDEEVREYIKTYANNQPNHRKYIRLVEGGRGDLGSLAQIIAEHNKILVHCFLFDSKTGELNYKESLGAKTSSKIASILFDESHFWALYNFKESGERQNGIIQAAENYEAFRSFHQTKQHSRTEENSRSSHEEESEEEDYNNSIARAEQGWAYTYKCCAVNTKGLLALARPPLRMCAWATALTTVGLSGAAALSSGSAQDGLIWATFGFTFATTVFKSLESFIQDGLWEENKHLERLSDDGIKLAKDLQISLSQTQKEIELLKNKIVEEVHSISPSVNSHPSSSTLAISSFVGASLNPRIPTINEPSKNVGLIAPLEYLSRDTCRKVEDSNKKLKQIITQKKRLNNTNKRPKKDIEKGTI